MNFLPRTALPHVDKTAPVLYIKMIPEACVTNDDITPLQRLLIDRIGEKGRITFAEYMAACLYEPGLGYYTSPGRKVGAEGDFYTSSNVHALFGRLIARELCRMWEVMGSPERFDAVEPGAAGGRLACDILDAIRELEPELYDRLTYRLIEAEPSLRPVQEETLRAHRGRIAWSSPEALASGKLSFTGCILSNELLDAFPVHAVEMTPDCLKERYVTVTDGRLTELLDDPSTPALAKRFRDLGVTLGVGHRAEVNLALPGWLASVERSLQRGFVLTVDYGYEAAELYGPMRRNGTLLCYWRHTVEEDPFRRPGEQDMTSHVDFTTLMREGERLGLATVWFGEQYRFLMAAGMMAEMMALEATAATEEERLKNRLALKKLMLPEGGMGDTFRVLVQAKGVDDPPLLCRRTWGSLL